MDAVSDARGSRRDAGFTLVELLVACAVMMVALLLAAQLFEESGRVFAHSVARERDPWAPLAEEWLRDDLRSSHPPDAPEFEEQHGPLVLTLSSGETVSWQREGTTLVRAEVGGAARTLLQQVDGWRWRALPRGAVEAEVRFRRGAPFLRNLAGSLPQPDQPREETLHWLIVARGAGSDSW